MKSKIKSLFTLAILLLCIATTTPPPAMQFNNNIITTTLNQSGSWKNATHLLEDYSVLWVFPDGEFERKMGSQLNPSQIGNAFSFNDNNCINNLNSGATTLSTNIYGDDDDASILVSGGTGGSGSYLNNIVPNQNILTGNNLQIQTGHHNLNGNNYVPNHKVMKQNEFMLILTAGDIEIDQRKDIAYYDLYLYFNSTNFSFINSTNNQPSGENYYSFGQSITPVNNTLPGSNLGGKLAWRIPANLISANNEKNIYALFNIIYNGSVPPQGIPETVYAHLLPGGLSTNAISTSNGLIISSAYDPNIIEVDKPVSSFCGTQKEKFEFTVHFQNIGNAAASIVDINLDLDPALDISTLQVIQASIGNNNLNLANTNSFSNNVSSASNLHAIHCDRNFKFSSANLRGLGESNISVQDTKGYIIFTIDATHPFSALNNCAGIVFDSQSEVVTNFATVTCTNTTLIENTNDCSDKLSDCKDELRKCKKGNNSNDSKISWLGWIIAGIFFILLIFVWKWKK